MIRIQNTLLTRRSFTGGAVGAITIAASRPALAGGGKRIAGLAFAGNVVVAVGAVALASSDGGVTWSAISTPRGRPVAITCHSARPDRLIVSVEGGGLEISPDRGQSWADLGRGLPDAPAAALATAAQLPDTLYAAIPGDGLWRSEDGGETWEFAMDRPFIGGREQDVLSLASVDLASGMGGIWLYGGTTAGLQRVPDCFCRWQDVQPGNALDALVEGAEAPEIAPLPAGEPVHALVSCAAAPSVLHAALPSGIWTTGDSGVVWRKANPLRAHALAVDPANPANLVAATEDGLFHSRDGGTSWAASAAL